MIIPFGFDFVLLIVCTYYAVKTRWADNTIIYNTEDVFFMVIAVFFTVNVPT